jgi:hypothetical protein
MLAKVQIFGYFYTEKSASYEEIFYSKTAIHHRVCDAVQSKVGWHRGDRDYPRKSAYAILS